MTKEYSLVLFENIEQKIFLIRGQRVMIDRDMADLYQVETKQLNRQVKRNRERFPAEFMFQSTTEEKEQLVTNWHRFKYADGLIPPQQQSSPRLPKSSAACGGRMISCVKFQCNYA
jgi:2,3-bisphosphoglycerate-independent phosphoglycerate mutase